MTPDINLQTWNSSTSSYEATIKNFGVEYQTDEITITNNGNTELVVLKISCDVEDFLTGVLLVSETINSTSITASNVDFNEQLPKSISVGDDIKIKLKIKVFNTVVFPAHLMIETNEDGGKNRVYTIGGNLPTQPRIETESSITFNNIVYPQPFIKSDSWRTIKSISKSSAGSASTIKLVGDFETDSSSSDFLNSGDYLVVSGTRNYNGLHRVISAGMELHSETNKELYVEFLSGDFDREEVGGKWVKVTNNPLFDASTGLTGTIMAVLHPSMAKFLFAGISVPWNQFGPELGMNHYLDDGKQSYYYSSMLRLSRGFSYSRSLYGEGPNYDGKLVVLMELSVTNNTVSDLLEDLGMTKMFGSFPGLSKSNSLLISDTDLNEETLDADNGSSTILESNYLNGINKVHHVAGAYSSNSILRSTFDSLRHVTAPNFVSGTEYTIYSLGSTTQAQWNTAAGTTNISYEVGKEFTAQQSAPGTGKAWTGSNKDLLIVVLDTPGTTGGGMEWGNVHGIVAENYSTSTSWGNFKFIGSYETLIIKNTGKDTLKIKDIEDIGSGMNPIIFDNSDIMRVTSVDNATEAKDFEEVPAAGYTTPVEILPGSRETYYLMFNKMNFGTSFFKTTLRITCNSPQIWTGTPGSEVIDWQTHEVEVKFNISHPQIRIGDNNPNMESETAFRKYEKDKEINFEPLDREPTHSVVAIKIVNTGKSDLFVTNIELFSKNSGVTIENDYNISSGYDNEEEEKIFWRTQNGGNQNGSLVFQSFFLKNEEALSEELDDQSYTYKIIYLTISTERISALEGKNHLRIFCNSNPNSKEPYQLDQGGYIKVPFTYRASVKTVVKKKKLVITKKKKTDTNTRTIFDVGILGSGNTAVSPSGSGSGGGNAETYRSELETAGWTVNASPFINDQGNGAVNEVFATSLDGTYLTHKFNYITSSPGYYQATFYSPNIITNNKNSGDFNNGYGLLLRTTYPDGSINEKLIPSAIKIFDDPDNGARAMEMMPIESVHNQHLSYYYVDFRVNPEIGIGHTDTKFAFVNSTEYLSSDNPVWQWEVFDIDSDGNLSTTPGTDYTLLSYTTTTQELTSSLTTKHLYLTFDTVGKREIKLTFQPTSGNYESSYSNSKGIEIIAEDTSTDNLGTFIDKTKVDFGVIKSLESKNSPINIYNLTNEIKDYKAKIIQAAYDGHTIKENGSNVYLENTQNEITFQLQRTNDKRIKYQDIENTKKYTIVDLGTTSQTLWNSVAGTTVTVYEVGDTFTASQNGSGSSGNAGTVVDADFEFVAIQEFTYPENLTIDGNAETGLIKVKSTGHGLSISDTISIYDSSDYIIVDGEYKVFWATFNSDYFYIKPKSTSFVTNSTTNRIKDTAEGSDLTGDFTKGRIDSKSLTVTVETSDAKNRRDLMGFNSPKIQISELGNKIPISSYYRYSSEDDSIVVIETTTNHGLSVGNTISIVDVNSYNYTYVDFAVKNVLSSTEFIILSSYDEGITLGSELGSIRVHTNFVLPVTAKFLLRQEEQNTDLEMTIEEKKTNKRTQNWFIDYSPDENNNLRRITSDELKGSSHKFDNFAD